MSAYTFPIKMGIIIFPIIALLFTIPYMIKQYHKFGAIPFLRTFIVYSFILYLLTSWFMVILPLPKIETVSKMTGPWMQLVPFNGLVEIIRYTNFNLFDISTYISTLKSPLVYTVLFNFFLTLPFGVYLRYYFNRKWWEVIVISFLLSLFFEVTQLSGLFGIYPRPYRLFDVDDLIVNTLGGFLGFLITPLFEKFLPSRDSLDEKSYEKGKIVSFPRKSVATLIDFVLISIVTFSGILNNDYLDLSIYSLIILLYFMIFTIIFRGRTIGKFIVGIKLVDSKSLKNARIHQILVRYILIYFMFFEVYYVTFFLNNYNELGIFSNIILLIVYISLVIIYFNSLINYLKKKPVIYEEISMTKHMSTIRNKKVKIDNDNE